MLYAMEINPTTFPPARLFNISQLLNVVLPLMMSGAALIFLVMTLYGAFNLLTHGDNPEAIKKAYSTIVFAVVGLVIVIASFVGVKLIGKLLGVGNILP
ncbi:hypothetical protein COY13_01150 [Candidatus Roizmanbacteria bacterium CG_4_10_14_0_2_um_filter_36_35]|uniref:Yip1 domain-containing protein n=4 Tax=Candidatus Roizmaniibacteriota TaxID=1752723 RepID=A0A2M7UB62_9BACT|nr:MAG: hypothetical protein COV86_00745 [Candidatus Roizmanbacteria bacterium CG11_big_fil_rev_8_21_14_0_20_35_14]PIZ68475.1 MAG: hypothetical protein COY13_01150 [Candidatus Roizmanbacteria bacterium CG_4_10_14_0_2_um_filter_36_35]PJC80103.1 MAG: hypothetical protein CO008_02905 [Candidatus Roizmanbacteria bacterium CG_4_8_14_3_um_filter_36_12]